MLKAAIAGTGLIATKKHLPALKRLHGRVTVTALVDPNLSAARKVADEFGVPTVYPSITEMLAHEQIDLLDICTPPRLHAPVAIEAIEGGCNVMIEKPMAVSVEECDQIIAAAERHGARVCVGHSDLFYPPFMAARQKVNAGEIGEFRGMRVFLSTPVSYMTSREEHWAHGLPGGVIGESGPHVVYMTLAYINPIAKIEARGHKLLPQYPWSRFEDYRIDLVGEQGVSSITAVYTSDQWAAQVDIWGTEGLIRLDLETMALINHRRPSLSRGTVASSGLRESLAIASNLVTTGFRTVAKRYRNTHDHLLERFVDSIERGAEPPVTAGEGREAVRVMAEIALQLDSTI